MEKIRNEIYIKHEINSLKDPKIIDLFRQHKIEGYGVYWMLLEYLQGTETGTIQEKQIEKRAPIWLQTDAEKASEIVKTCLEIHLLEYSNDGENSSDGEREIYSPMLKEQREEMKAEKDKWRNFGKKGAEAKKEKAAAEAAKATTETATEETATAINSSETIKRSIKKICAKFKESEKPIYYRLIKTLIKEISDGDEILGAEMIDEALEKYDKAAAIKNGKMTFTIMDFLNPIRFLKLHNGSYDKDYSKPRSRAADAGLTFENIDY
jgi:hypothetical protein